MANAATESKGRVTVPERWNAAGPGADMWMDAAQDPRVAVGTKLKGERATLLDYLRGPHRRCGGGAKASGSGSRRLGMDPI
jgi:hypothetical protein